MSSKKASLIFLSILLVFSVAFAGCSSPSTNKAATQKATTSKSTTYNPEKEKLDRYSAWFDSLGTNVKLATMGVSIPDGYTGWVVGEVTNVYFSEDSNGQPTFIDFGAKGYESTRFFTAIVWGEDLGNFDGYNLNSLVGKTVAVKGSVYTYKHVYKQVQISSPSQINVCPV